MKEPWLAVFLTKIFPGAGHIYAGRKSKGIVLMALYTSLYLTFAASVASVLYSVPAGRGCVPIVVAAVCGPVSFALLIYALFNSHKTARLYNEQYDVELLPVKKKPWLAVFLSMLLPGVGQFYNGSIVKGIMFIVLLFVVMIAQGLYYLLSFLFVPLYLLVIKDAFDTAEKINGTDRKLMDQGGMGMKAFVISIILIGAIPYSAMVRTHSMQAFRMPSGSMLPTLYIGDHILVDKSNDVKRNIQRGDIIVFKYPKDPARSFIKRVAAVEGDIIEGNNKVIFLNGKKLEEDYIQHTDTGILLQRDTFGPLKVPENSYFMLGDNRDASYDSRFWGYVTQDQILGKAFKVYWSLDKKHMRVRWDRLGSKIE